MIDTHYDIIRQTIAQLNLQWARVMPPATDEAIAHCNRRFTNLGLPTLPEGYIRFLKITNGLSFNGMDVFGTTNCEIVEQNIQQNLVFHYYKEVDNLLFFGRIDDDVYTYHAGTGHYESRDINGFEVWDEYDTFEAFFIGEMRHWLL